MKPIERLELANQQTWWLPSNVVIHEGTDHCFYCHDGMFRIVRFTPPKSKIKTRLQEILNVVGKEPVRFTYLPHRHSLDVLTALKEAGFVRTQRCEARVIDVDHVTRPSPPDIQVIMVQTFAQMKRIYTIRKTDASVSRCSWRGLHLWLMDNQWWIGLPCRLHGRATLH